jgi:hypothetical protein
MNLILCKSAEVGDPLGHSGSQRRNSLPLPPLSHNSQISTSRDNLTSASPNKNLYAPPTVHDISRMPCQLDYQSSVQINTHDWVPARPP